MDKDEFEQSLLIVSGKANELCRILSARVELIVQSAYESSMIIVQDFKDALYKDRENNPSFYYWKHFCVIEKGATAVIIRWKKYSGKSKYSDSIDTSGMKNFKIPSRAFIKCSKPEKKAIMLAEHRFSKIRRINFRAASMMESARALKDMTAFGEKMREPNENDILASLHEIDLIGEQHAQAEREQYEFDREKFRRSLGL